MNTKRIEDISIKLIVEMSKHLQDETYIGKLTKIAVDVAKDLDSKLCELELEQSMRTKESFKVRINDSDYSKIK